MGDVLAEKHASQEGSEVAVLGLPSVCVRASVHACARACVLQCVCACVRVCEACGSKLLFIRESCV